eukprot:COSAG02_NODE_40116_length_409_cov_0.677419_1_plen_24_part_10
MPIREFGGPGNRLVALTDRLELEM